MPLAPHDLVCVDFDDTLVVNQEHFDQAVGRLAALLHRATGASEAEARAAFERVDARYHRHGRHRNRFLLTVLATWCEVSGQAGVPLERVPELAACAAMPYDAPPEARPGAAEALARLRAAHRGALWLVTAGDLVVQTGRVHRSGLAGYFDALHVLPNKDADAFAALGRGYARRLMIGNSPATDIVPALEAGFEALHVREATWALDAAPLPGGVPAFPSFAAAVAHLVGGRSAGGPGLPPNRWDEGASGP